MYLDVRKIPAYYINLDSQPERRERTEKVLSDLGFITVNRISAIKHEDPKVGCALSHHKVMSDKSIKAPFLLLEDDIEYTGAKFEYEIADDVDSLYLGCSKWGRFLNFHGPFVQYKKLSDDVVRVYNMLSGHAVLHFREGYREHLSRVCDYSANQIQYHMDVGYAETQKFYNVYALDLPFFSQRGYNEKVSRERITSFAMDFEESARYFEARKWDLKLSGIDDGNGWHSFYDPRHWTKRGNP